MAWGESSHCVWPESGQETPPRTLFLPSPRLCSGSSILGVGWGAGLSALPLALKLSPQWSPLGEGQARGDEPLPAEGKVLRPLPMRTSIRAPQGCEETESAQPGAVMELLPSAAQKQEEEADGPASGSRF